MSAPAEQLSDVPPVDAKMVAEIEAIDVDWRALSDQENDQPETSENENEQATAQNLESDDTPAAGGDSSQTELTDETDAEQDVTDIQQADMSAEEQAVLLQEDIELHESLAGVDEQIGNYAKLASLYRYDHDIDEVAAVHRKIDGGFRTIGAELNDISERGKGISDSFTAEITTTMAKAVREGARVRASMSIAEDEARMHSTHATETPYVVDNTDAPSEIEGQPVGDDVLKGRHQEEAAETESYTVSDTYEALVAPDHVRSYAERIASEEQAFDPDTERAAIARSETDAMARLQRLLTDEHADPAVVDQAVNDYSVESKALARRTIDILHRSQFMDTRAHAFAEHGHLAFRSDDPEVKTLLDGLMHTPDNAATDTFVEPLDMRNRIDTANPAIRLVGGEQPIHIQLKDIVSAESMHSWTEGRDSTKYAHDTGEPRVSAELIKEYAGRSTEIPALDDVLGIVAKDGSVQYIVKEGAHRTAAAKMRGLDTVATKNLTLYAAKREVL